MTGTRRLQLVLAVGAVAVLAGACSSTTTGSGTTTSEASTTSSTAAGGGADSGGAATISSVVITGTTTAPTITVNGSGLGTMPSPNPTYTPAGTQLCPLAPPAGNQGYDYGTSLFMFDVPRNWAGGRYRPELNELDCVGVLVTKFTPTQVVFQFGAAYAAYQQKDNYLLAEGDAYQLAVNGATYSGTVHYTQG